ncbi:MAG: pirin family protein [Actinomycetota bacterium]|nr:pirin family protein [Actinomycetota bacterium]
MSGPVASDDTIESDGSPPGDEPEVAEAREGEVGGLPILRALPRRGRRTVGPWCFVDVLGPAFASEHPMLVGPHPHTGLATVTWLVEGEVVHRDSLGVEQLIRPGQVNLMTAGRGVAHAEESPSAVRSGRLFGVQLWFALPDETRTGPADFEHHGELPRVTTGGLEVALLVGSLDGVTSPVRADAPAIGAEITVGGGTGVVELDPTFEHLVVVLDGGVGVEGVDLSKGGSVRLAPGRHELVLSGAPSGRALLLGGVVRTDPIVMWWNFVARTRDEIDEAMAEWAARGERFGDVTTSLARIDAPPPPWR